MTIYFESDTHYGHKNIIKYSKRPYASVDEMNEALIANHNSRVRPEDTVYHLGDFAFLPPSKIEWILSRLNGKKFLIFGNHDEELRASRTLQDYFGWCKDYHEMKVSTGNEAYKLVLCHFPMITWNKAHRGSMMLHGHCHGSLKYPFKARIMDVGVDPQGMFPISLDEVVTKLKDVQMEVVDHHGE